MLISGRCTASGAASGKVLSSKTSVIDITFAVDLCFAVVQVIYRCGVIILGIRGNASICVCNIRAASLCKKYIYPTLSVEHGRLNEGLRSFIHDQHHPENT